MEWSTYQNAIFENIVNDNENKNTVVIARAGSSKTTSLVEAVKRLPKTKKILVTAFNKHIQEEISKKLPQNVDCLTLHALGFRAIKLRFKSILKESKTFDIIKSATGQRDYDLICEMNKAVTLSKYHLLDTPTKIDELMDNYNIDHFPITRPKFIDNVLVVMRKCKEDTAEIDFSDMLYFPFVYNMNVGKYDYVFVDEAQDMNYAQLVMAMSARRKDARLITVLDDRQAIYSFSGADFKNVNDMITNLNPVRLPLPISYRCPKQVIKLAQNFVPDIMPYDKSLDGKINYITLKEMIASVKVNDVVLSRTNADLISACISVVKKGIPASILGKDIGNNLSLFIKRSKAKSISELIAYTQKWQKEELEKFKLLNKDTSILSDRVECLFALCYDSATIEDLKNTLKNLFDESDKYRVLFSTVHKYKGKEADNIFLLDWTFRKTNEEENNIQYVAITRSKKNLTFVSKNR